MTDEELQPIAAAQTTAEMVVALAGLDARPGDFVFATPERVFVGGDAVATFDGVVYRHTGDGTFTRHEFVPEVTADPAERETVGDAVTIIDSVAPVASDLVAGMPVAPAPIQPPPAPPAPIVDPTPVTPMSVPTSDPGVQTADPVAPISVPDPAAAPTIDDTADLGPRPKHSTLTLPDGQIFELRRPAVIGRAPEIHPDVVSGSADSIRLDDSELSRTHVRFVLNGMDILVEDLGSTNGSRLGAGSETMTLQPNVPVRLVSGAELHAGTSTIRYEPASPPQT